MNNKQKLGYMALGATILAVGMAIGQWVTPNIEAQHNGVFDKITCRELQVVDASGKEAVVLVAQENESGLFVYDKVGNKAISLIASEDENSVSVLDEEGNKAIQLATGLGLSNSVSVYDKTAGRVAVSLAAKPRVLGEEAQHSVNVYQPGGLDAIKLTATENGHYVTVWNYMLNGAIQLGTEKNNNHFFVFDKAGNYAVGLIADETNHSIVVYDKAGNHAVQLAMKENENNVLVFDKAGNQVRSLIGR